MNMFPFLRRDKTAGKQKHQQPRNSFSSFIMRLPSALLALLPSSSPPLPSTTSLSLPSTTPAPLATSAPTACNGHPELCNRAYSNITQIGAHDSAFVGPLPQDNQNLDLTSQLNAGIRFLQAQTHLDALGTLSLCHTTCLEKDAGPLTTYLSTLKTWLDANPSEVLTLLLVNGDNLKASAFDTAYTTSGLKPYAYTPPKPHLALDEWPTLQDLIKANTRLIAFLDAGADTTSVPYLLDEFTYFFETPYDTTDPSFPQCTLDRPPHATADGRMYIVNHFLDVDIGGGILIPDRTALDTTNAATGKGSIGAQADLCVGLYGRGPVGVLVDFFDQGDVFTAQNRLNRLA
ncbi:hypothetical protein N7G274_008936 [Stereocaulon virgatum]|uniref:PLC-like phosphodiesterase n=1 Tax=Stereocaulon virgatum TaxID=373712 RepID=A0ABR3ZXA4_9LECA